MLLKVDETLVGVDYLLEVKRRVHDVCERVAVIVALIELIECLNVEVALHYYCREDSTCEATTVRDEIDLTVIVGLQLLYALQDFGQMLVLEWLVDAYVIVSPTEMRGCLWLHAGTGTACDSVNRDVALEKVLLCQWQESQLNTGRETAWVGYVTALACVAAVQLGQAVDEIVVVALYAVIHREVNDLELLGQVMAVKELACVAVRGAEEEKVYLLERHLVGEYKVCLAV